VSQYRVYVFDVRGHIDALPRILDCASDGETIQQARQLVDGKTVEVWLGMTCTVRIEPEE